MFSTIDVFFSKQPVENIYLGFVLLKPHAVLEHRRARSIIFTPCFVCFITIKNKWGVSYVWSMQVHSTFFPKEKKNGLKMCMTVPEQ